MQGLIDLSHCCSFISQITILSGVKLLQEKFHDKVLVQTGNMKVIETIKKSTQILQEIKNWSLKYITRKENKEVNRIVKFAFSISRREGLQIFVNPPFESL